MAQETDANTVWLNDSQRQKLNEWMAELEEQQGFEPKPGQAVASACTKAIEVEQ